MQIFLFFSRGNEIIFAENLGSAFYTSVRSIFFYIFFLDNKLKIDVPSYYAEMSKYTNAISNIFFRTNKWALETRIFRVAKIRTDIHNIEVLGNHI